MAPMLYWIVYHLDLGRLGLKVLDLAVQSWLIAPTSLSRHLSCDGRASAR